MIEETKDYWIYKKEILVFKHDYNGLIEEYDDTTNFNPNLHTQKIFLYKIITIYDFTIKMYNVNLIMEALSLYENNKLFRKTSKLLQTKYKLKITRQTIMNWNKWMKIDVNKICKKRITVDYCNKIILSKQKIFKIDILNDINKLIIDDPFITRNDVINTIYKKHNVKLSQNSIFSIYKKLNLTRKKPRHYIVKSIDFLDNLIE